VPACWRSSTPSQVRSKLRKRPNTSPLCSRFADSLEPGNDVSTVHFFAPLSTIMDTNSKSAHPTADTSYQLAQLAEENHALIENSLDLIALLDPAGRFLRVNEAVYDILGYRPAELLGRRYCELLHPDELEVVRAAEAALRTGRNTTQDMEKRWVRKDGSVTRVSVSVRWSEHTQLMYATARDVTERYRTQNELQKSKNTLDSMLESIGEAFFAVNSEWRVTYANRKAAAFVGTSREDSIGSLLLEVAPDLLSSPSLPHYKKAMETREQTSFDTYWEPSGVWLEVRVYLP
jgi:PAS domain S-box-containing protein